MNDQFKTVVEKYLHGKAKDGSGDLMLKVPVNFPLILKNLAKEKETVKTINRESLLPWEIKVVEDLIQNTVIIVDSEGVPVAELFNITVAGEIIDGERNGNLIINSVNEFEELIKEINQLRENNEPVSANKAFSS